MSAVVYDEWGDEGSNDVKSARRVRRDEHVLEMIEASVFETLQTEHDLCMDCAEYEPDVGDALSEERRLGMRFNHEKPLQHIFGRDRYGRERAFSPDAVVKYTHDATVYDSVLHETAEARGLSLRALYDLWERTSPKFKIEHKMLGVVITGFVEEASVGDQLARHMFSENAASEDAVDDAGYSTP